jgi:dynein heavy chain, axonemal
LCAQAAKLPGDYDKTLNDFERLVLLRALRPDRITTALKAWIGKVGCMSVGGF